MTTEETTKRNREIELFYYGNIDSTVNCSLYDKDWQSLMPVVEKIGKLDYSDNDFWWGVVALNIIVNIEELHERVYEFCKWYNENKKADEA